MSVISGLLNRRAFIAGASTLTLAACAAAKAPGVAAETPVETPINPLVRQRADARIFRHTDGLYYMMASVPEYDRLAIRRAPTLAGLSTAEEIVVWRQPASGKLGGYIWAPELHDIDGRWYIYFAAGDSDEPFHIRTYVLRNTGRDALADPWELMGQFQTPWDTFTLDSTLYVHRGRRYACWAQKEPGIDTNSNLYLAPLATPTTLAAPPARLTVPTLDWEIQGYKVAEGPALIEKNGRLFLTYSASATDDRYCLGLLTADADADIMSPAAWTKSPKPVFVSSDVTKVYGPGHNSFTVDEQGRDVLVYHGRDYRKIKGDPLFDPNRHTRIQRLYFGADGAPDFGIPVGNGEVPDRFSPADSSGAFWLHDGGRMLVGSGPLPSTQFRQKPGLAGAGTVTFEPIDAPGQVLRRTPSGDLVLAPADKGLAADASFQRIVGLSDPKGVSFAVPGQAGVHLRNAGGQLRAAPVTGPSDRPSATFLLS
jgi:GH43 family beta-xylosidase